MVPKAVCINVYCLLMLVMASGSLLADDSEVVKSGAGERVDDFFTRFEAFGFRGSVLVATGKGELAVDDATKRIVHMGRALADQGKCAIVITPTRWSPVSTGGFPESLFED